MSHFLPGSLTQIVSCVPVSNVCSQILFSCFLTPLTAEHTLPHRFLSCLLEPSWAPCCDAGVVQVPVDCCVPTCFGELCTGSEVLLLRTAQTRLCQCWRFCLCLCSAVCLGHCWFCHSEKCVCPPPTWGTRRTGWEAAWDRWISALCRSSCPACLTRGTIPRLSGFLSGRGWLLRSWGFLACSCLGEWRPSIWMLLPHAVVCCHLIICSLQYSWREVKRGCLVCWELSCWKHTGAWLLHVLSNALFFVTMKWYKSLWLPLTIQQEDLLDCGKSIEAPLWEGKKKEKMGISEKKMCKKV